MTDLLHRLHMGRLTFDHAGYIDDEEYTALSAEENRFLDEIEAAMGASFTQKYLAANSAVWAYSSDQDFQQGVRLGAQLMLAVLEPL